MSKYTIQFTQTETQNVNVEADTLEAAQELAKKHICRIGMWTLNRDQYIVDGKTVESINV
jgi:hypothetical protein